MMSGINEKQNQRKKNPTGRKYNRKKTTNLTSPGQPTSDGRMGIL